MTSQKLFKQSTVLSSALFLLLTISAAQSAFAQVDHFKLGNDQFTQKDYDGAIKSYTNCISDKPASDGCFFNRGLAYYQKENWDASIADYNQVLKLDPQNAKAFIRRAIAYTKKQNYEMVQADYESALKIDPNNEAVQKALKAVKDVIASTQKVQEVKQQVFETQSDIAEGFQKTAAQQLAAKDYDAALVSYTKCVTAWPMNLECYYKRSFIYGLKKDYDKEIADLTAVSLFKPLSEIYHARGIAYRNKNDYDSAIKDFTKAAEKAPNNAENYYDRSLCFYAKKEYSLAFSDLSQAIKMNPQSAKYFYVRGIVNKDSGSKAPAIADFKKALEISPGFGAAKDELQKLGTQP